MSVRVDQALDALLPDRSCPVALNLTDKLHLAELLPADTCGTQLHCCAEHSPALADSRWEGHPCWCSPGCCQLECPPTQLRPRHCCGRRVTPSTQCLQQGQQASAATWELCHITAAPCVTELLCRCPACMCRPTMHAPWAGCGLFRESWVVRGAAAGVSGIQQEHRQRVVSSGL